MLASSQTVLVSRDQLETHSVRSGNKRDHAIQEQIGRTVGKKLEHILDVEPEEVAVDPGPRITVECRLDERATFFTGGVSQAIFLLQAASRLDREW